MVCAYAMKVIMGDIVLKLDVKKIALDVATASRANASARRSGSAQLANRVFFAGAQQREL